MRLYIAGPWTRRDEAAQAAEQAVAAGHIITHEWWRHECGDEDSIQLGRLAELDYEGVVNCDAFIVLNLEKSEGKAVEQGIALTMYRDGLGGPDVLIGVGPRNTNIFQNIRDWQWVETFDQALSLLADRKQPLYALDK